jgi:hypothetical protein
LPFQTSSVIFVANGEGPWPGVRLQEGDKAVTKPPSDQRGKAVAEVAQRGAKVVLKVLGARSTAAEAELLDIVRGRDAEFVLSVHCHAGRWKVRYVVQAPEYSAREGVGVTFAEAWANQPPA